MTLIPGDAKDKPKLYDFNGRLQFLLQSADISDTALITRRAVEIHAFQISLYYPYLSNLPITKERLLPKADMIALARKYAALKLYNYYGARTLRKNAIGMKRVPSLQNIQTGLANNFKRIEVLLELLKDYLFTERDDPGGFEKDVSQNEFENEMRQLTDKSRAVAKLIKGYITNGDELRNTLGRPIGNKIMREALGEAGIVAISQKTLLKYFNELEPTAVFHYLIRVHYCKQVLCPICHYDADFPQKIIRRARSIDELRGVCLMYNTAVTELNDKYRFNFPLIENVPKSETETNYDTLIHLDRNAKLTEAIRTVTGHTA
jgi:hypothetical protein